MADITEYDITINFKTKGSEKAKNDMKSMQSSMDKLKNSVKGFAIGAAFKKLGETIFNLTSKTSDYIETLNLFRASMGSAADEATKFIKKAEDMLGLDPKVMMDSISQFYNMADSLGIASDRAYLMSQNMTQLAADLSSFANISMEAAQSKLMSGLSGQVKPLREYGIAIDQATLQETAYSLGIQQRVKDMTRAQKTELIYYQIMTQTTKMQGDLGRSLISPANALRILKTEFSKLGRAVGSVFIPIMMKIIPVVRAVTQILTEAAQALARFFGFKLSDYEADLSSVGNLLNDVGGGIGDIGDEAEEATAKLNKMLMPFDELNNISSTSSGGGSGVGGVGGGGGGLGVDLPYYDMFETATNEMTDKINRIKDAIKAIIPFLAAIGAIIAGWKISNSLTGILGKLLGLTGAEQAATLQVLMGLTLIITGVTLAVGSIKKMLQGDLSIGNLLAGLFGGVLAGAGGAMVTIALLGSPIGMIIGIALILAVAITWMFKKEDDIYQKIAEAQGLDYDGMTFSDKIQLRMSVMLEVLGLKEGDEGTTWGQQLNDFRTKMKTKISEIVGGIGEHLGTELRKRIVVKGWLDENWDKVLTWLDDTYNSVVNWFKEQIGKLGDWFKEDIFPNLGDGVLTGFLKGLKGMDLWDEICNLFNDFVERVKKGLGIHSPSTVFEGMGQNIMRGLVNGIQSLWGTLVGKFNNIKNLTNFNWSLPHIKIPHLYWTSQPVGGWVGSILNALNLPASLPKLNIEWYASGGFPDIGQLFIANEAGPELVGNIGGKTAVANQDQITTAIANATYKAISKALAENNSDNSQPIVVNIGNEQLYKGFTRYQNEQSRMYGRNL